MQIDPNTSISHATRQVASQAPSRVSSAREGEPRFDQTSELNRALEQTPAVRPGAVARARELIGDVKYPPDEAINGIAKLLSMRIESDGTDYPTED